MDLYASKHLAGLARTPPLLFCGRRCKRRRPNVGRLVFGCLAQTVDISAVMYEAIWERSGRPESSVKSVSQGARALWGSLDFAILSNHRGHRRKARLRRGRQSDRRSGGGSGQPALSGRSSPCRRIASHCVPGRPGSRAADDRKGHPGPISDRSLGRSRDRRVRRRGAVDRCHSMAISVAVRNGNRTDPRRGR